MVADPGATKQCGKHEKIVHSGGRAISTHIDRRRRVTRRTTQFVTLDLDEKSGHRQRKKTLGNKQK